MPRISETELLRIKQDVPLLELIKASGIKLKKHGSDYLGLCPFHDDKEPSLVISPDKNLWHCLGACNEGGDVIKWVQKLEGVSFRHAVELLQSNSLQGTSLAAKKIVKNSTKRKLGLDTSGDDKALLCRVIEFYHKTLLTSDEGLSYLDKRGLNDLGLIQEFKLGLSNRTLGYRLPAKQYKAGKEVRNRLQGLGILRSSGHEHFSGSLVIPVLDGDNVVEVYGRKIRDNLRKGTPKHLYLPGSHSGVFNAANLNGDEIILCESLIDALSFYKAGFKNVTTSYGVSGFTAEHLDLFSRLGVKRVLIAYDNDEAGNKAAIKLAGILKSNNIDPYRLIFPKGMDVNEYALSVTPADKSLGVVIRSAEYMGDTPKHVPKLPEQQPLAAKKVSSAPLNTKAVPETVVFMILCQNLKYDNLRRQTWKQNLI